MTFFCCGFEGPDSYQWQNGSLPQSCCVKEYDNCFINDMKTYKHEDCVSAVVSHVKESFNIIGGTVIGITALELIGAFLGLCIANSIKNEYRRSRYA